MSNLPTNPVPALEINSGLVRRINMPASRPTWAIALILSCVIIGVLASLLDMQLTKVKVEKEKLTAITTSVVKIQSEAEDVGKLLSDSNTQWVYLGASGPSAVHEASLAWNEPLQKGVVFCDKLPALDSGGLYAVVAICNGSPSHPIGLISVKSGTSIFPFKFHEAVSHVVRFEIRESNNSNIEPMLSGDIR